MFSITHMGSWKVDRLQSNFYSDHICRPLKRATCSCECVHSFPHWESICNSVPKVKREEREEEAFLSMNHRLFFVLFHFSFCWIKTWTRRGKGSGNGFTGFLKPAVKEGFSSPSLFSKLAFSALCFFYFLRSYSEGQSLKKHQGGLARTVRKSRPNEGTVEDMGQPSLSPD